MKIEIDFNDNDKELKDYFQKVDIPARCYIAKQLIRIGISSGMNPYIPNFQNQPKVTTIPEFDYEKVEVQDKKIFKPKAPPVTKTRELTLEEKKKNLNLKLKGLA